MNTHPDDRQLSEAERAELDDLERLDAVLRARAHAVKKPAGSGPQQSEAGPSASER